LASSPGPAELSEVADQRLARTRVLDLDGHVPAVLPDRAVHLADRRGRDRRVVERDELRAPVLAEVAGQHPVHAAGGHRRCGLLQLCQRRTVGPRQLRRQRGLEDGQRLPELHRAALELAEHTEDLVGGALLDLLRDYLCRSPPDPLAEAERRPSGEP
jgi:hypothetical protein